MICSRMACAMREGNSPPNDRSAHMAAAKISGTLSGRISHSNWSKSCSRPTRICTQVKAAARMVRWTYINTDEHTAVWREKVCKWRTLGNLLINALGDQGDAGGGKIEILAHDLCKQPRLGGV